MKIYLLRHPKVGVSKSMCYGRLDVPLAPGYEAAVGNVLPLLPDPTGLKRYSSPASRCRKVLDHLEWTYQVDDRLQELDFGEWEGREWGDLPKEELEPWSENFEEIAPPGGERVKDMANRASDFWNDLITEKQDALVVAHTGWIRVLLAGLLEIDIQAAFRIKIDFLGLTLLKHKGLWTEISYINRVG